MENNFLNETQIEEIKKKVELYINQEAEYLDKIKQKLNEIIHNYTSTNEKIVNEGLHNNEELYDLIKNKRLKYLEIMTSAIMKYSEQSDEITKYFEGDNWFYDNKL